jgi:molybdopterin/thiamine biosynthesis adenylyltransferase
MFPTLSSDELHRYEWQLSVRDFGEAGQRKLKAARVLVSRIGGVGGAVAMQLAAAGVGRLVLAHAGNLRLDDLNRQLLMSTEGIGRPRIESAEARLRALNPHVEIETVAENISEANAAELVGRVDMVVGAAPLFTERLLMNREAVRQGKPLVDSSMYDLEGRVMTVVPGETACLACLYSEPPPSWKRQFPVFSAVASTVGSLAAMEAIKLIAGLGQPLAGRLLSLDLREMSFRTIGISRRADCTVCGSVFPEDSRIGST